MKGLDASELSCSCWIEVVCICEGGSVLLFQILNSCVLVLLSCFQRSVYRSILYSVLIRFVCSRASVPLSLFCLSVQVSYSEIGILIYIFMFWIRVLFKFCITNESDEKEKGDWILCHDHAERVMQSWSARFSLERKEGKEEKRERERGSIYRMGFSCTNAHPASHLASEHFCLVHVNEQHIRWSSPYSWQRQTRTGGRHA